ncbi:MAG: single-stranded-DNA-specific exonuclease RecJ [Chloroflexi bacterium]|nr:single-stranded-DNA-specific exonuclease RecJ [Chloroflexota bacterium]
MEARQPHWKLYPPLSPDKVQRVQAQLAHLQLTPLMVQILANRDVIEADNIEAFVHPPDIASHPDPLLLTGMRAAVDRICQAIDKRQKVVVYGDFDADGVTSTALLTIALRHFNLDVEPYVPNRVTEGYGLNAGAVREIASKGAKLLITVDCGISGRSEVAEAQKAGLDVIVTDHHHLPVDLPEAIACINPKQAVDGCECYQDLAGVGVAYQLVRALVKRCGKPKSLINRDLLALVAIGTVADIVPLKGANRTLVQQGLAAIPHHSLPGISTMLEYAHIKMDCIDTERIGFVIGPRLNAAGRIDDARTAYRLLMTEDLREARELAQKLEAQNRRRQALMNSIVEQAKERARQMGDGLKLILLSDPNWPAGVVGLVASRLVEEFGRPVLILEEGEGESRGSARSTPHLNMIETLTEVQDLLVRFGGHSAAAGFTVKTANIAELNRRLCEIAGERLQEVHLQSIHNADAELTMREVTDSTLDSINRLAPFGSGNPSPLFMAQGVRVLSVCPMGDSAHLKLLLADQTNISRSPVEAIAFRTAYMAEAIKRSPRLDILFYIERREWKGDVHLQLRLRDLRLSELC